MKKSQKGFITLAIAIIVLLAVIAGVYLYISGKSAVSTPADSSTDSSTTTGSLVLSINAEANYQKYASLAGATYQADYAGPALNAVILYQQSYYPTSSVPGAPWSAVAYGTDFRTIQAGGFTSKITVLPVGQTNVTVNGQTGQTADVFTNEGRYVLTISVYKCSDIIATGNCSSANVSAADVLRRTPIASVSKTITVTGEAAPSAGQTVLGCLSGTQDPTCIQKFTDLFQQNLQSCTPANGTTAVGFEPLMNIYRSYQILGVQNGSCAVTFGILSASGTPASLLGKTMICEYQDSERTMQTVADVTHCTGPLYTAIEKLQQ